MELNKTEQYTFGPEEQQILEILATFEKELEEKLQDSNGELENVKYYDNFAIKGMRECEISGVFLTQEKDEEGKISYHLYYQRPSDEILSLDHEGKMQINPKWREAFGEINFEKSMKINNDKEQGRVKGISEKASSREIQEKLDSKEKVEESPEKQIEQDLEGKEDFGISYYRKIKDKSFGEQIGQNLNGYEEIGLAYSKSKNTFILIGKNNDKFEEVEGFEEAQPTFKTVMSIDEKGEKVEKEVPHALMKTNNKEKEISITIGQYGYIEVGTVDRLPCEVRVKRQVQEEGETDSKRTDPLLNDAIEKNGIDALHDWAHKNKEEIENKETINIEDNVEPNCPIAEEIQNADSEVEGSEYIPHTDEKWEDFAKACGFRGESAIDYAKKFYNDQKTKPENQNKTDEELVQDIIDGIEEEYHTPNRNKG